MEEEQVQVDPFQEQRLVVLVAQEEGEGWLTLAAPTRFHATYVETHLMGRLMRAVRRVDPSIAGVRIEG